MGWLQGVSLGAVLLVQAGAGQFPEAVKFLSGLPRIGEFQCRSGDRDPSGPLCRVFDSGEKGVLYIAVYRRGILREVCKSVEVGTPKDVSFFSSKFDRIW